MKKIQNGNLNAKRSLKHGEKVILIFPATRKSKKLEGEFTAISIEVAKLFSDFVENCRQAELLNDACRHKQGLFNWNCCWAHRNLGEISHKLTKRAHKILPSTNKLPVLCEGWWKKLGFTFPSMHVIAD